MGSQSKNTMSKISRIVAFLAFAILCVRSSYDNKTKVCEAPATQERCPVTDTILYEPRIGIKMYLCEKHKVYSNDTPAISAGDGGFQCQIPIFVNCYNQNTSLYSQQRGAPKYLCETHAPVNRRRLGWKPSDDVPRRQF